LSTVESSRSADHHAAEILSRYRIGSVPYLNARPLVEGLADHLIFEVPSRLADRFAAGELDAALLPVYEAVSHERALIADDMAIASRGEVFSVFLAHREPLNAIETVALDPASHTSNHLLRCLFAEFHGPEPEYVKEPADELQARLLIGDPAIRFRQAHAADDWKYLDLGAEWMRCTGLPFVFACWVLREGARDAEALASALREVKLRGLAARERIASEYEDAEFVRHYLTHYIRFDLRAEEKQAIALFAALLRKHGLVDSAAEAKVDYV
jgi:predicted solute-binding protein